MAETIDPKKKKEEDAARAAPPGSVAEAAKSPSLTKALTGQDDPVPVEPLPKNKGTPLAHLEKIAEMSRPHGRDKPKDETPPPETPEAAPAPAPDLPVKDRRPPVDVAKILAEMDRTAPRRDPRRTTILTVSPFADKQKPAGP